MWTIIRFYWNWFLLKQFASNSTRLKAATALSKITSPRFIMDLHDGNPDVRESAILDFGEVATECAKAGVQCHWAVELLTSFLGDMDRSVRLAAVEYLYVLGQAHWGQWVKGDDEDFIRLAQSNDSQAVKPLVHALTCPPQKSTLTYSCEKYKAPSVYVARALAQLNDPRTVWPLIRAFSIYDDVLFRREAAKALCGKLGDPQALRHFGYALAHDSMERSIVEQAIGESKDLIAVQPLIKSLSDDDPHISNSAARILSILGVEVKAEGEPMGRS